jgi:hypothetical protein
MPSIIDDMPELEIALLRRSLGKLAGTVEYCGSCERALLIGERVYEYENGAARCALCRDRERQAPAGSHVVHTAAAGHSIRMIDRRPLKRVA